MTEPTKGSDARLRDLKRRDPDRYYAEMRERYRPPIWVKVRARFQAEKPEES